MGAEAEEAKESYYERNKEKVKEAAKNYYETCKEFPGWYEAFKAQRRESYQKNREARLAYMKLWNAGHRPARQKFSSTYYERNKERLKAKAIEYYNANREKILENLKQCYDKDKEKYKQRQIRLKKKAKEPPPPPPAQQPPKPKPVRKQRVAKPPSEPKPPRPQKKEKFPDAPFIVTWE
jgi:hypothetical protein